MKLSFYTAPMLKFGIFIGYIALSALFSIWPFSVARDVTTSVVNSRSIIQNYHWQRGSEDGKAMRLQNDFR